MIRLAPLLLVGLPACEPWGTPGGAIDTGAADPDDALVVSPAYVEFGSVEVGSDAPRSAEFTVTNAGPTALTVHGFDEPVQTAGPDVPAFFVDVDAPYFSLQPGESRVLAATFDPPRDGDWSAEVRVNYGVEVLQLRGQGHAPTLAVDVPAVPGTPVGCEAPFDVRVENTGRSRLVLDRVAIEGGDDFSVPVPVDGAGIAPGQGFDLALRFRPGWQVPADGTRQAFLRIEGNDPLQGDVSLPLSAFAYTGSEVVDTFRYHPPSATDVLFVADTDGVMSAHVDKAQAAMEGFLAALDVANVDLHAAVVTPASVCPVTVPGWVDSSDPDWRRLEVLRDGFDVEAPASTLRLLDHATDALAQDAAGGCLEGFLREGAALHVVALAGGPDASGLEAEASLAALRLAAPLAREVVVDAVIATESAGCGGVAYGEGYAEAALVSAGEIVDLCQPDWTDGFGRIAGRMHAGIEGSLTRPLAEAPLLDSLDVSVDGAAFPGWTWDAEQHAVVFPEATAPDPGSDVRLSYRIALDCD